MAKASFSAYVLGKNVLKTGGKVDFSTKKARPILVGFFVPSLSPFCIKMAKICCFLPFKSQKKVGRKRGLRHIYTGCCVGLGTMKKKWFLIQCKFSTLGGVGLGTIPNACI